MKKITTVLIALFVFVVLFSSCKKSNGTSTYFLTATINGISKNFTINPVASIDSTGSEINIGMVGAVSATTAESINIELSNFGSLKPIVPGSYSDISADFDVEGFYDPNLTASQYMAGSNIDGISYAGSTPLTNHFTIVISAIDKLTIKGSFSGNFYPDGDPSQTPISITNGSFYLKFHQ